MAIFINRVQGILFISLLALMPFLGQNLIAQPRQITAIQVDNSWMEPDGNLTEESVPNFLERAYTEKKLKDSAFSSASCLKAKNIRSQGGRQTLQLFKVTSTCNPLESIYIIKEPASGTGEANNLMAIEAYPGMKELISPKKVEGLPSIALPIAYLSYVSGRRNHIIEIMPAAPGKVFADFIKDFRDNPTPAKEEQLQKAYRTLGRETSEFYKRFKSPDTNKIAKTILHGDLHIFNLFYDGDHFTFIDAESIAHYLNNPRSPIKDIIELFFVPFDPNYPDFTSTIQGINFKTWINIALRNFIIGFLEPFPLSDHKQVLQELKQMFNGDIGWGVDPKTLKTLRDQEINPIFDELINKAK